MSETQSTFKTIAEAHPETTDDTPETPDVDRSDVIQVIPLPGLEQIGAFREWCDLSDAVADGVMAAINEGA